MTGNVFYSLIVNRVSGIATVQLFRVLAVTSAKLVRRFFCGAIFLNQFLCFLCRCFFENQFSIRF